MGNKEVTSEFKMHEEGIKFTIVKRKEKAEIQKLRESLSNIKLHTGIDILLQTYGINTIAENSSNYNQKEQRCIVKKALEKWPNVTMLYLKLFKKLSREDYLDILDKYLNKDFEMIIENIDQFTKLNIEDEKVIIKESIKRGYLKTVVANAFKFINLSKDYDSKKWLKKTIEEALNLPQYKIVQFKKRK